jgi:hypothetical protein
MTENDILEAIGDIDSAYLEEAKRKPVPAKMKWIGVGSLAACFLLLFIFPMGYRHFILRNDEYDYAPQAYEICSVYYVKDHILYSESVGVVGGDIEMFDIWKEKNNIDSDVELKNIVFSYSDSASEYEEFSHCETVSVTVSAILEAYFENEDGTLLLDALKNTIASYRKVTIGTLTLIYL